MFILVLDGGGNDLEVGDLVKSFNSLDEAKAYLDSRGKLGTLFMRRNKLTVKVHTLVCGYQHLILKLMPCKCSIALKRVLHVH